MDHFAHHLADLLLEIEAQMRHLGLWEQQPPPPQALASLIPFCHDTLLFEQWLQWVLLVKLKQVVEDDEECPASSEIAPLAEYRLAQLRLPATALLRLIERLDQEINREGRRRGGGG
jgi:uncharacterized protein YqcC (DUF446 family)